MLKLAVLTFWIVFAAALGGVVRPEEIEVTAGQSFELLERALNQARANTTKLYLLAELARLALEAGEKEEAWFYASELLNRAEQLRENWMKSNPAYGNALHHGHLILGSLALNSGNLEQARIHLIEAGRTPGSPQLEYLGPGMSLARGLLERGERKKVLEYLRLCSRFWKEGRERLRNWSSLVEEGRMPDFGKNLNY